MSNEVIVYKISDKGIEEIKSFLWSVEYLEKIGIVISENAAPYLVIEYKEPHIGEKGEMGFEMKTQAIK